MTLNDWFTTGAAVTGAALGFFNLWRQLSTDRVRVRVTPSLVMHQTSTGVATHTNVRLDPSDAPRAVRLGIEVLNLSAFPVTIDELGMTTAGSARKVFVDSHTADGRNLPVRIEPRDSVTFYTIMLETTEFAGGRDLYADTACGTRSIGRSPAIESLKAVANTLALASVATRP